MDDVSPTAAIITRDEAKASGLKRYFTGEPCKRGHVAERYVNNGQCCGCATEDWQLPERKARRHAYNRTPERKAYEAARRQRRKTSRESDAITELETPDHSGELHPRPSWFTEFPAWCNAGPAPAHLRGPMMALA